MDYNSITSNYIQEYKGASNLKDTIVKFIKTFESNLSDDLEIALIINSQIIKPVAIAAHNNENLIIFDGAINGATARIIQNVSQTNFTIIAVTKDNPQVPPKRIGFRLD